VVDTDSPTILEGLSKDYPQVKTLLRPQELRADTTPTNEILVYDTSQVPADLYLQTHSTNPLLKLKRSQPRSKGCAKFIRSTIPLQRHAFADPFVG
jgi:CMP-N-acetylneuraminic acid synthetase